MIMQGQVGGVPLNSATDGKEYNLLLGKQTELLVSELHGKWTTQNWRGLISTVALSTATALVAPATNATPNFCLWNPAGNTTAIELIAMQFGYVSGTPAAAAIGYSYVPMAGATYGGTSAISAFTGLTIRSSIVGKAYSGNILGGSAATCTGTAPAAGTLLRWSGLSNGAIASASVAAGMVMTELFDGTIIIPPNTLFYPVTSAASVATYMISAVFAEIAWP
jgi:hypothetical protein